MDTITLIYLLAGSPILLGYIILTFNSLWYIYVTFPKKVRPNYQLTHFPPVIVFVPCKGVYQDFEANVHALLQQGYPNYTIVSITESKDDPAADVLKRIAANHNRLHVVVAGPAITCCQKNHNLLAGIDYAKSKGMNAEVYIFADMDIRAKTDWIIKMIAPLRNKEIFVVSGFRWLIPQNNRFSNHLHAVFNAYLGLIMAHQRYAGMWGGSMALLKEQFESFEVYEKWSTAMVDDISLSWIIKQNKLKRIFSPDCMVYSEQTFDRLSQTLAWFIRQTQYGSNYLRKYAAFGVVLNTLSAFFVWMFPVAFALYLGQATSIAMPLVGLFFYGLACLNFALLKFLHNDRISPFWWVLYAPFFLLFGSICSTIGFFSKKMKWANITYRVNRKGDVLNIIR